jgi:outer membrane protein TolC
MFRLDAFWPIGDAANQEIKLAMAHLEQAEAGARYARSFLFPTISLGARRPGLAKRRTGPTTATPLGRRRPVMTFNCRRFSAVNEGGAPRSG